MIEAATRTDLPEIHALLERLALEGVDAHLPTMLVARKAREMSAS